MVIFGHFSRKFSFFSTHPSSKRGVKKMIFYFYRTRHITRALHGRFSTAYIVWRIKQCVTQSAREAVKEPCGNFRALETIMARLWQLWRTCCTVLAVLHGLNWNLIGVLSGISLDLCYRSEIDRPANTTENPLLHVLQWLFTCTVRAMLHEWQWNFAVVLSGIP